MARFDIASDDASADIDLRSTGSSMVSRARRDLERRSGSESVTLVAPEPGQYLSVVYPYADPEGSRRRPSSTAISVGRGGRQLHRDAGQRHRDPGPAADPDGGLVRARRGLGRTWARWTTWTVATRWSRSTERADALEWAGQRLAGSRADPSAHRPWADVWRVDRPTGRWWLKINSADTRYEPRLLDVLARSGSALLPAVLTHPDQPWALIADAGTSARELLADAEPEQRIGFWIDVLPAYAELQRTVPVADLRAAQRARPLPGRAAGHLRRPGRRPGVVHCRCGAGTRPGAVGSDPGLPVATGGRGGSTGRRPPPTLQHDDLHDGNVFRRGSTNLIIDWGDAVLAHPFGTLLVTLDVLAYQLDCARTDPRIVRVQEAYLEVWRTGGDSRADLAEELDLAVRTAGLGRAAGWRRALGTPDRRAGTGRRRCGRPLAGPAGRRPGRRPLTTLSR